MSSFSIRPQMFAVTARCFLYVVVVCWCVIGNNLRSADAQGAKSKAAKALPNLESEHRETHRRFAESLEKLAQTCEKRDLAATAIQIRRIAQPVDPNLLRFEPLPREVQQPIPNDLVGDELAWRTQLREHRQLYAEKLDVLAHKAVKAGLPTYAYQLTREVAHHDPDHTRARRLLGFVRYKDEWVSLFEADKLKRGEVWTDRWGWLKEAHVSRYQNGERLSLNGRWVSAEKDAELRRDFSKAWEIRTEHYLLKTNESLERGVELATSLEDFHRFFQQTFAAFFNDSTQMQKLFENPAVVGRTAAKPFVIHFFSTRDEYIEVLIGKYNQQIKITNGLYDTDKGIVYTFNNPGMAAETTLFHEATHQILAAHLKLGPVIARNQNFWLIEGVACYIESFQRTKERLTLGDPRYERFVVARYRLLNDGYYLPLAQFTAMGKDPFQLSPQIQNNYSQASGLVHFFMHYERGLYRDDLIEHLRQIYQQAERPGAIVESLEDLAGVSFADLDRQYAEYVRAMSKVLGENFAPQP